MLAQQCLMLVDIYYILRFLNNVKITSKSWLLTEHPFNVSESPLMCVQRLQNTAVSRDVQEAMFIHCTDGDTYTVNASTRRSLRYARLLYVNPQDDRFHQFYLLDFDLNFSEMPTHHFFRGQFLFCSATSMTGSLFIQWNKSIFRFDQ